jgi:hypothetical protein
MRVGLLKAAGMKKLIPIACLILIYTTVIAGDSAVSGERFAKAAQSTWSWLHSMDGTINAYLPDPNRSRFADAMQKLHKLLGEAYSANRDLFINLNKDSWTEAETLRLQQDVTTLSQRINEIRHTVHEASALVRDNAQARGGKCEEDLISAAGDLKSWAPQLGDNGELLRNKEAREKFFANGVGALRSLHAAELEAYYISRQLDRQR